MEFVNRDFNAAINIRRCAVLKTGLAELTQPHFMEQPLRQEVYEEKLKPIQVGLSKKGLGGVRAWVDIFPFHGCETFSFY